jgi:hypothetical protein
MSGVSGTFQAGETISIGTETAKVVTGGTSSITFMVPSSKNFFPGDSVIGATSGATGVIDTTYESFTGVDKNIKNLKEDLDAIKTEILLIKSNNPDTFWWQSTTSITELSAELDAIAAILETSSYDEDLSTGNISSGNTIDLPLNSREVGTPQQYYIVGKGALEIYLNGQRLSQDTPGGWSEVGTSGSLSMTIQTEQDLFSGDILTFRLGFGGIGSLGGGGGGGSPGGSNQDIQYNNSGSFAGSSNFKIDVVDGSLNLNGLRQSILSSSITIPDNSVSPVSIFSYNATTYRHAIIEYSIVRNGSFRTGNFLIANDGSLVGFNDSYVHTSDVGITLTSSILTGNVLVLAESTSTGQDATIKLSMRRWS